MPAVCVSADGYNLSGVNGVQIEGFKADEESIMTLMECAENGKITEAHAGYGADGGDKHCSDDITNSLGTRLARPLSLCRCCACCSSWCCRCLCLCFCF